MSLLTARLRAYAPNGALIGSLPHPLSWEMALPLNDVSSLTVSYPVDGAGAEMLLDPAEVAVELMDPDTGVYTEYPNCRFLCLRRQSDLQRNPGTISLTMPGYGWQLRKVRMLNTLVIVDDGRRPFTDAPPGFIMKTLIDESKGRGNIPGLTYDFTSTEDSAGVAWPIQIYADFDLGQDAWSSLDALSRQGLLDWRFNGRMLQMYVASTFLQRNLATEDGIILHSPASVLEEPADRTLEDLARKVIVVGDEGSHVILESSTALTPWGEWEEYYQAGGVSNTTTMTAMAQRILQQRERARIQYTKQIAWQPGLPVPLRDFGPGDYIRARSDSGNQLEPMRVFQITMNQAETQGIFSNLVLNDRFTERSLRNERWLNRTNGVGGPVEGGGSGGGWVPVPGPPPPEERVPQAPENLTVTSESYIGPTGQPIGRAQCSWDLVTLDTEGDPITPDRYQLAARRTDLPPGLEILASVQHPGEFGFLDPLDGGYNYRFQVRAVSRLGLPGPWSNEVIALISLSDIPPPKPSTPLLSSKLGTIKIEWDGLSSTGTPMPVDFTEVQVEMSTTGGAPWVRIGEIFEGGSAVIAADQPVGEQRWFRFIARNTSNLFSTDPSDIASIVVVGIAGPDIEANSITANQIAAGTITAEEIAAYSINVDRLSVGDNSNMVADPLLGDPDLNAHRIAVAQESSASGSLWEVVGPAARLTKNSASDTFSRFPVINNVILTGNFTNDFALERPGLAIQVTKPSTSSGGGNIMGRFRVSVTQGTGAWSGVVSVSMLAIFYNQYGAVQGARTNIVSTVSFNGAGTQVLQSTNGTAINEGASFMVPYVYISTPAGVPSNVTVSLSEFEIWQESSVYIGDGRISAPLIQANAIDTNKLAANAITAKHTIQSAQYYMVGSDGDVTLRITNNANYQGQPGIQWFGPSSVGLEPAIFMVDPAGTGGWDPNALVHMGPEATANDTGRVDIMQGFGVAGSYMKRNWGPDTTNNQGIAWITNNASFNIMGQLPSGARTNDLFRGVVFSNAGNVTSWTLSWGSPNWIYAPVCTPTFANAADSTDAANATCLVTRRSESGFRVVSSRATNRMNALCFAGGSGVG